MERNIYEVVIKQPILKPGLEIRFAATHNQLKPMLKNVLTMVSTLEDLNKEK